MTRRLLNLLTALSLVLCAAEAGLWIACRERPRHLFSTVVLSDAYTVRSDCGRIMVAAPPAGAVSSPVGNDRLQWYLHQSSPTGPRFQSFPSSISFTTGGGPLPSQRQLLRDLRHPDRFAAAHALLTCGAAPPPPAPGRTVYDMAHGAMAWRLQARPDMRLTRDRNGQAVVTLDGLRVLLWPGPRCGTFSRPGGDLADIHATIATIDPAQHPGIRDLWYRRLLVPRWWVPHWAIVSALAALPAGRLGLLVGRRRRAALYRRRGLCPACGYDLTGNVTGVCPECGTEAAQ